MEKEYQAFCKRGILQPTIDTGKILIFGLGLTGEAGEVADIIKKIYGHGKAVDIDHIKEELGDVLWYVTNLCSAFDMKLEDVMKYNMQKLQARYPEDYKNE